MVLGALGARLVRGAVIAFGLGHASGVLAAAPEPWQLYFQPPASPVMERLVAFHDMLLVIIIGICVLVLGLLLYVIVRFRASRNPVPSRTSHNTVVEVLWTVVPVIVLVIIAIPSFRLLYFQDRTADAEMTLKVVGHQWYWSYEYSDDGGFTFDANLVSDAEIKPGQRRLLETDNRVVLPVDTNVRLLFTSTDVLHSWAVPALGVKMDTIPGKVNETWTRITKPGTYFGQCSELCGVNHGFMPVAIDAVSKEDFAKWVAEAKQKFARADGAPVEVATATQ
ncbi:MAG: cytochrome c oxidase subunit II [Proteobacteria bacterium]|nr:cytochrome c oxidase subunit II [Pseudomonadota bacterium]